jgi:hypothetical protein
MRELLTLSKITLSYLPMAFLPMASKTLRPLSGHGSVRGVVLGLGRLKKLNSGYVLRNFFGVYYIIMG